MKRERVLAAIAGERSTILTTLFIGVTFLWTSNAYLTWTAHLTPLASASVTYMTTEVYGCLAQVLGLALLLLLVKYDVRVALQSRIILAVLALDGLTILPMLLSREAASVVVWGIVMNLLHGAIAGHYIALLSYRIQKNRRAFCFGVGYAIGNVGSWLLSLLSSGRSGGSVWLLLAVLIAASMALLFLLDRAAPAPEVTGVRRITKNAVPGSTCLLAGILIFLLALTNQFLFFFPAQAYLSDSVDLEFSHMFYAVGLVVAALINDKKRVAGLVLALVSLCFPLLTISLYQFSALLPFLSVVGFIVMGFYSVYRIVVFADLHDEDSGVLYLAPLGLLCGKTGEGLGAALGQVLGARHIILSALTAFLFAAVIILAFILYVRLYSSKPVTTLEDRATRFYRRYNISSREQQVFLLLVDGKTNPEIAEALNISENTVKFHIKNILKKTACAKRVDVILLFRSFS